MPTKEKVFDPIDKSVFERTPIPDAVQKREEMTFDEMYGRLRNDRWKNVGRMVQIPVFSTADTVEGGDGKAVFFVPPELDGVKVVRALAFVTTVSSSGAITVQVRNATQSLDMLSTALTIDQSENSSLTAATPAVITSSIVLRSGDLLYVDCDEAGTGAKGLGVQLSYI